MTKILCDFHHGGLIYSLHLLFEKRLGFEMYVPCGMDWWKEKMWVNPSSTCEATARQYLDWKKTTRIAEGKNFLDLKGITLDEAKSGGIDYILSSISTNDTPFAKLKQWNKDAVLISQWGNPHQTCNYSFYKNILNSTLEPVVDGYNSVNYHQEFDLGEFSYIEPPVQNRIRSFVMWYGVQKHAEVYRQYKKLMPDYDFKMYGCGDDGSLLEQDKAQGIKDSSFMWYYKPQGDGYGYVIHMAYACGRPVITKRSFNKGMLPEKLFTDDTCIDLDVGTAKDNIENIRAWSSDIKNISKKVRSQFDKVVNFDDDEQSVRKWLKRCT